MRVINIHHVKTHLSRLIEEAGLGESFIIAKAGRPVAMVVPLATDPKQPRKRFGFATTPMIIPDDFNRMGAQDLEAMFDGA